MKKSHFNIQRETKALAHTGEMELFYREEIEDSIQNSYVYRENVDSNTIKYDNIKTEITVEPLTTTDAIIKYSNDKCAALNFASFKYPGGGFIRGSIAQEEALCHDSFLYNVLSADKFKNMYADNRLKENQNHGLYTNFGIYSPNILFEKKHTTFGPIIHKVKCNIITVAAPNLSVYHNGEDANYINTMYKRIKFVLDIAKKHNNDTLILGAFGCGVFKNDPTFVSTVFKELLNSGYYNFKKVIFAVPSGPNYTAFAKTFNE